MGDLRHQREHGSGEEYPDGTGLTRIDDQLDAEPDPEELKKLREDRDDEQAGPEREPGGRQRVKRQQESGAAEHEQDIEQHDALEGLEDDADETDVARMARTVDSPTTRPVVAPPVCWMKLATSTRTRPHSALFRRIRSCSDELAQVHEHDRQNELGHELARWDVERAGGLPVQHLHGGYHDDQAQEGIGYPCHHRPGSTDHGIRRGQW